MKKKIVVFGSKGFIANSFKESPLTEDEFKIIMLGKDKYNILKKKNFKKISTLLDKNTTVLFTSTIAPSKTFNDFVTNIQMALNLKKIVNNKKVKNFIYISSDAVYTDTKKKINENSKCLPGSLHGLMHLVREKIFTEIFGKTILILRPTLLFGSKDTHNGYGPNMFTRLAKKNKTIKLYGKGEERRDHLFIDDLIRIIFEAILKNKKGIFNISTGKVLSFFEIAKNIIKVTNSKSKIIFIKRNGPPHHLGLRQFDIKKIKKNFPKSKIKSISSYLNEKFIENY